MEEKIVLKQNKAEEENSKSCYLEYGGYCVNTEVAGEGNFFKGIYVSATFGDNEGVSISIENIKGKLHLSIDSDRGRAETEKRTHAEWYKLEQLESAVRLINGIK